MDFRLAWHLWPAPPTGVTRCVSFPRDRWVAPFGLAAIPVSLTRFGGNVQFAVVD
jgi:hypothetical protein